MGPKAFITCYVCSREFGSRSIPFHEPKCLERWRSSNKNLPPEKRLPTPVKPVGWKHNTDTTWLCTNCQVSVPACKRGEHASTCFREERAETVATTGSRKNANGDDFVDKMTVDSSKKLLSPSKKRKESRNGIEATVLSVTGSSAVAVLKTDSTSNKRTIQEVKKGDTVKAHKNKTETSDNNNNNNNNNNEGSSPQSTESDKASTSDRSIRPQTKTLRRPTPNLKHPVIQFDSDESSDNSDKSKEEDNNPKRMKHSSSNSNNDGGAANGTSSSPSIEQQKPKNFIMYNKYNVERNTKTSPKERSTVATKDIPQQPGNSSIPYPCNSCSRSFAPERLHSHTRKDTVATVLKKTPSAESKTPSPKKKSPTRDEKTTKTSPKSPALVKNKLQKETDGDSPSIGLSDPVLHDGSNENDKTASTTIPKSNSMPRKMAHNVSMNVCYLCGKDPSPTSLMIHERKCLQKWKKENGLVSPSRRKKSPSSSPQKEAEKVTTTDEITKIYEESKSDGQKEREEAEDGSSSEVKSPMDPSWQDVQAQLVPCPSCGRTFFPERLPVHQRVCKGKVASGNALTRAHSLRETATSFASEENADKQSMYVPCYICGKNFGTWVIQMHESQCLRKWRRENEKMPPHLQQQEPHKPQLVLPADESTANEEESTDVAWESHLQQLVPCQRCGRTFFPDRLEVHGRSCKGPVNKQQTPRNN